MNFYRICMLLSFIVTSTSSLAEDPADHKGNGGNLIRIIEKSGRVKAVEIVSKVTPSKLVLQGIIPLNIRERGVTMESLARWYKKFRNTIVSELKSHPVDTSRFAAVVDKMHANADAYTVRRTGSPIYFNTNSDRIRYDIDAAWIWINEVVHHIPDDKESIDRSTWKRSEEDDFSALITSIIRGSWVSSLQVGDQSKNFLRQLMVAIDDANLIYLRQSLSEHPNINLNQAILYNGSNKSPLSYVMLRLSVKQTRQVYKVLAMMLRELINAGASVDTMINRKSVFDYLSRTGYFYKYNDQTKGLLTFLLESSDPDFRDFAAEKILFNVALLQGDSDFVDKLLDYEIPEKSIFNVLNAYPYLRLLPSANMKLVIEKKVSSQDYLTQLLFRLTTVAWRAGGAEIAELLIDRGAKMEWEGMSILNIYANAYSGNVELDRSKRLDDYLAVLKQNSDIESYANYHSAKYFDYNRDSFQYTGDKFTPLGMMLAREAKLFWYSMINPKNNDRIETYRKSARKFMKTLSDWGGNFNVLQYITDREDHTPLSLVAGYMPYEISKQRRNGRIAPINNYLLELLLEFGANPGLVNSAEQTPYLWASFYAEMYQRLCRPGSHAHPEKVENYQLTLKNYKTAQKILEAHPDNIRYGVIRYDGAYCNIQGNKMNLIISGIGKDGEREYR